MYFERTWVLYFLVLLILIPLLLARSWYYYNKFESSNAFRSLKLRATSPSWSQRYFIAFLRFVTFGLIIVALAQPYIYITSNDNKYNNIRLVFMIDVSRSMAYAEDIKPTRLVAAKNEIRRFIESLDGVYESAIIPFAGHANVYYCPFTYSKSTFFMMLNDLDYAVAPSPGTNISNAFVGLEELYEFDKKNVLNLVIVLSDGGKEESIAVDRSMLFANIKKLKLTEVYTVGIGGDEPTPLMMRDSAGNFVKYILDDLGNVSYSKLDETILEQIAEVGNGKYKNFKQSDELYFFLREVIDKNRVMADKVILYEKLNLMCYILAIASIFFWYVLLTNRA